MSANDSTYCRDSISYLQISNLVYMKYSVVVSSGYLRYRVTIDLLVLFIDLFNDDGKSRNGFYR